MSIEITSLTKNFGAFPAVKDVSLHIKTGEMVAFLGPSLSLIHISEPTRPY